MKKYYFVLIFLVIAALACFFLFQNASVPIKNLDSQGKNIICFGDSLTYGEGASPGSSYPDLLQKQVLMPVINAGVNGDTTKNALKRLDKDVLEKEPYLVIVELGGNDFLKEIPKQETIQNLEEIVKKIQDAGAIVALTEIKMGLFQEEYSKEYRRIAKNYGALIIPDILDGIMSSPELKSDPIHPNDEGYKIITQRILKEIRPFLKGNKTTNDLRLTTYDLQLTRLR